MIRKFTVLFVSFVCICVLILSPTIGLAKSNLDVLRESLFGEAKVVYGNQMDQMSQGDIAEVGENINGVAQYIERYPLAGNHIIEEWHGAMGGERSFANIDHVSHCELCLECARLLAINTSLIVPKGLIAPKDLMVKETKWKKVQHFMEELAKAMADYSK